MQGNVKLVGDAVGESREDLLEADTVGLGDVMVAQREEFVDKAEALVDEARRVGAAAIALLKLVLKRELREQENQRQARRAYLGLLKDVHVGRRALRSIGLCTRGHRPEAVMRVVLQDLEQDALESFGQLAVGVQDPRDELRQNREPLREEEGISAAAPRAEEEANEPGKVEDP